MFVKAFGSSVQGIDAITIRIEVNVSMGQGYAVVGLPDSAVRESLHRTESAIKNMGYHMPRTKVIVNLAPADYIAVYVPKKGIDIVLEVLARITSVTKLLLFVMCNCSEAEKRAAIQAWAKIVETAAAVKATAPVAAPAAANPMGNMMQMMLMSKLMGGNKGGKSFFE